MSMTKEDKERRAGKLRLSSRLFRCRLGETFTYKARGVAVAGDPDTTCTVTVQVRTIAVPRERPKKICFGWPEANRNTARAGKWMHEANPMPRIVPRVRRNQGKSVVAKVAEKLPAPKLKLGSGLKGARKYVSLGA